ncbi:MAG TPA: hypothetical protein DER11_06930 [Janibacter terrae]|nr:hypothetical protein [Janibacter terrae]
MTLFFTSFIRSAVVAFVAALVGGVAVLSTQVVQETPAVEFTTAGPSTVAPAVPAGALEAAHAHAEAHGLTDCVDPAHARLDDVILTVPADPGAEVVITPVGFDEALDSGALGRWNLLACSAGEGR